MLKTPEHILESVPIKSEKLFAQAESFIPGGVNSPVRAYRAVNQTPRFIDRAKGCRIWDADGIERIDMVGSWGPMILGHANEAVITAVKQAADRGLSYGAPTGGEIELAEIICEQFDSVEKVRLVNSCKTRSVRAISLLFSEPVPRDDQSNQRARKSHPLITKRWLPASTN